MSRKTALVFVASLLAIPAAPSKAFAQLSPTAEWATHAQNEYQVMANVTCGPRTRRTSTRYFPT